MVTKKLLSVEFLYFDVDIPFWHDAQNYDLIEAYETANDY